jgi:hypothetical protein
MSEKPRINTRLVEESARSRLESAPLVLSISKGTEKQALSQLNGSPASLIDYQGDDILAPENRNRLFTTLAVFFSRSELVALADYNTDDLSATKQAIREDVWKLLRLPKDHEDRQSYIDSIKGAGDTLSKVLKNHPGFIETGDFDSVLERTAKTIDALTNRGAKDVAVGFPEKKLDTFFTNFENALRSTTDFWREARKLVELNEAQKTELDDARGYDPSDFLNTVEQISQVGNVQAMASVPLNDQVPINLDFGQQCPQIQKLYNEFLQQFSRTKPILSKKALLNRFLTDYHALLQSTYSKAELKTKNITQFQFDMARAPLRLLLTQLEMEHQEIKKIPNDALNCFRLFDDYVDVDISNEVLEIGENDLFRGSIQKAPVLIAIHGKKPFATEGKMLGKTDFTAKTAVKDEVGARFFVQSDDIKKSVMSEESNLTDDQKQARIRIEQSRRMKSIFESLFVKLEGLSQSESDIVPYIIESRGLLSLSEIKEMAMRTFGKIDDIKIDFTEDDKFTDARVYFSFKPNPKKKSRRNAEVQIVMDDNLNEKGSSHHKVYERARTIEAFGRLLPSGIPEDIVMELIYAACLTGEAEGAVGDSRAITLQERNAFRLSVIERQFLRKNMYYDRHDHVFVQIQKEKQVQNKKPKPQFPLRPAQSKQLNSMIPVTTTLYLEMLKEKGYPFLYEK